MTREGTAMYKNPWGPLRPTVSVQITSEEEQLRAKDEMWPHAWHKISYASYGGMSYAFEAMLDHLGLPEEALFGMDPASFCYAWNQFDSSLGTCLPVLVSMLAHGGSVFCFPNDRLDRLGKFERELSEDEPYWPAMFIQKYPIRIDTSLPFGSILCGKAAWRRGIPYIEIGLNNEIVVLTDFSPNEVYS
jgi:hypothetical protein